MHQNGTASARPKAVEDVNSSTPDSPPAYRDSRQRPRVVGGLVKAMMAVREMGSAEIAARAGVSLGTIERLLSGEPGAGRYGMCQIVRALHLAAPIPDCVLGTLELFTGISRVELVGGEAGSQRLERALGVRGDEPVYADLSLREVGRVLRQLRLDRALTEAMVASPCLVLSEAVVQAVENGAVSMSPWLRDVLVPAMLRSIHRVQPIDHSDARFLDGLLGLPAGHLAAYLSRGAAEGGAA